MKRMNVKEILIPALSLFLICAVVTVLLGVTNAMTEPKIEALALETQETAKKEVLKDAATFSEEKQVQLSGTTYAYYEGLSASGDLAGYVFQTAAKGYGGDLSLMVGIGTDGAVQGVTILTIQETAGLGMNAKNPDFLEQFVGKSKTIGVQKNGSSETEIQALTGATITSNAMAAAVNQALALYAEIGGDTNG